MPGTLMAMGRLNRPSLMIYGGTIKPGMSTVGAAQTLDIVSAFQSYGGWRQWHAAHAAACLHARTSMAKTITKRAAPPSHAWQSLCHMKPPATA